MIYKQFHLLIYGFHKQLLCEVPSRRRDKGETSLKERLFMWAATQNQNERSLRNFTTAYLQDKIVVLEFWLSWSGGCSRQSLRWIDREVHADWFLPSSIKGQWHWVKICVTKNRYLPALHPVEDHCWVCHCLQQFYIINTVCGFKLTKGKDSHH